MDIKKSEIVKTLFASIKNIFFGLLAGQIIYFMVGLFLIQSGNINTDSLLNTIFMFVTPVFILVSVYVSKVIYIKLVSSFDKSVSLENKIISYRSNNLIKLAILEGANLFNISVMIITSSYLYAAFFVILITLFFLNKPTKDKLIMDYEVTAEEVLFILS